MSQRFHLLGSGAGALARSSALAAAAALGSVPAAASHELHERAETDTIVLSALLADVDAASPTLAEARALAAARERGAAGAGAWSDPFIAAGPDEYAFDGGPPMVRIELTQAIPLPGKLTPLVDAARAAARGQRASVDTTGRSLRVTALQLFLRALYLERAIAAHDEQQRLLDDVVASMQASYAAGGGGHHEVLLAGAEKAVLERSALVHERELMMVTARLDELRGLPPRPRRVRLVDDRADGRAPVPATLDEALADQPELALAAADNDAAGARARGANVSALPDLFVQGMWMQSFRADEPSTAGAMVGVSVPLFFWWKQGPAVEAAERDQTAFKRRSYALRLALAAEWEEASLRLRSARESEQLYRDRIGPSTAAAFESTKAAYAAQAASFSELLSLMRASSSVALERFAAELDVRLAEARLRHLLSSPAMLDLTPASPTLFSPSSTMGAGMPATAGSRSVPPSMQRERAGMSTPAGSMTMPTMGGM